jgi:L-gulonate 5-dehydrogenase
MKAIEVIEPGKIAITERSIPEVKEDEVLIRVKAAGICGSDVHIYHGKNAFATYPRVVGHEFVGEITKAGTKVTTVQAGDRVVVDPVIACGHCYPCRVGRHNVCKSLTVLGVHRDGGYQEYVAVPAANAYKLPDSISWEIAAMIEPYSIAAQVLERGRLTAEDTVLICGAGPIGLILLQAAKMRGARVAIMDIIERRLAWAKDMGADLVINAKNSDMVEEMKTFTNQEGANLIFEATGNVGILETCIHSIASPAGRVVVLGFSTDLVKIPQVDIMSRELEIIGTRLNKHKMPEVIDWFAKGLVQPEKILTHTFSFEEAQKAFDFSDAHPEEVCKIGLKF